MSVSLIIGAAGLVVAVAGFFANWWAIRREQADRRKQIDDEWAREWAAQRPIVYPLALPDWTYASMGSRYGGGNARLLPLKNGGRGPALEVQGEVSATAPDGTSYSREILAGPIAAGVPHQARNMSDTEPATAIVARNDPNEQESVVLYTPSSSR